MMTGLQFSPPSAPLSSLARPPLRSIATLPNLLTLLFLCVCGTFIFRHALWIDEAQAFVLARDSHSIPDLLHNLRYEGHPPLWHLLLFVITRFTPSILGMQALHLALAATTVYLVARCSPFPLVAKILFPFGYFPLFEYGIISRNYQLVMLLASIFCALFQRRRTAYVRLAFLLALLCLSHVMGVIIVGGLGVMLLLDAIIHSASRAAIRAAPLRFIVALGIAIAGAAASVILLKPPPDYGYSTGWHFAWNSLLFERALLTLQDGLLPLPPWRVHFWGGHPDLAPVTLMLLGVGLAVAGLFAILHSWRAITFYTIAILGQCAFSYIKFVGGIRHHGGLFITLLAALWIAWSVRPAIADPSRLRRFIPLIPRGGLILFLAAHVYCAAVALYFCWQVPFASGRAAALALQAALRPDDLLVADTEFVAPVLAAYIPGITFQLPSTHRVGNFIIWRERGAWDNAGLQAAIDLAAENNRPVLWVARDRLFNHPRNITEIGLFDDDSNTIPFRPSEHPITPSTVIDPMEKYAIYRITP